MRDDHQFEYDTVSVGRDGVSAQDPPVASHGPHALVDRSMPENRTPCFGGQGGSWLESLEELVSSAGIESELSSWSARPSCCWSRWPASSWWCGRSASSRCGGCVRSLPGSRCPTKQLTAVAISGPGILLTQMAAIRALTRQGLDLTATPPVAMAGHSQGIIACESLQANGARDAELLALLQLIGAAGRWSRGGAAWSGAATSRRWCR